MNLCVKLTLKEVLNAVLLHLLFDFEVLNLLICGVQSLIKSSLLR